MNKSDSIGELAKALALFQQKTTPLSKDSTNPAFGSGYTSLAGMWEQITPRLGECGLSVTQIGVPSDVPGTIRLETVLMHISGEWMSGMMTIPVGEKKTAQAVGSALTYSRRYGLGSILGLVSDDDDDGHQASQPNQAQYQQQRAPQQQQQNYSNLPAPAIATSPADAPTGNQLNAINAIATKLNVDANAICQQKWGFQLSQANRGAASELIKHMQAMQNAPAPAQPPTQAPVTPNAPDNVTGVPPAEATPPPAQPAPAPTVATGSDDDVPF